MSRSLACTLHLWPPPGHARHCTGSSRKLAGHALGRGAQLTQVQLERGGSGVLAQTEPGDVVTGPVFPEDSWVQVRYPLASEQGHATGPRGRGCPAGWSPSAARMSGRSACRPRNWPLSTKARPGIRPVSGTPPRSACPTHSRTWTGLPGPNTRRNEHPMERARLRARPLDPHHAPGRIGGAAVLRAGYRECACGHRVPAASAGCARTCRLRSHMPADLAHAAARAGTRSMTAGAPAGYRRGVALIAAPASPARDRTCPPGVGRLKEETDAR